VDRSVKRTEWERVLREAREEPGFYGGPAYQGLLRLLTLAGRVPYRSAAAGLTDRELALVQLLLGRNEFVLVPPEDPGFAACAVVVAQTPWARVSLHESAREDRPAPDTVVAGIAVPDWLLEMVDEECAAQRPVEAYEQAQLDELLRGWAGDGSLDARVAQAADWVERVESVLVYIGRSVFSKTDGGSNTLVRGDMLGGLPGRHPDTWSVAQRLFVAGVHLMFRTGKAVRFEEYNGRQLTAAGLKQALVRRCCGYLDALGETPPADLAGRSFLDLAALVGDLAPRLDAEGALRYRRINGVPYVKEEFLLPWDQADRRPRGLPPAVRAVARAELSLPDGPDPVATVTRLGAEAARLASETKDSTVLERLIESLVHSAVVDVRADYGMSSGIRQLGRLRGGPDGRVASMLALKKPDFFCCVIPSARAADAMKTDAMSEVLWSVAQRMMFNRWHFVPGNFERDQVPYSRHYFFPPLVPDISEWADLRHGGHVAASVRYSIRVPGAPMWQVPFEAFGHPYRGSYDIRVVRMQGPPFELDDVRVLSRHCALIDACWRGMLSVLAEDETADWVINGFDRQWYESYRWRRVLDGSPLDASPLTTH
jgi:hypothetical protein